MNKIPFFIRMGYVMGIVFLVLGIVITLRPPEGAVDYLAERGSSIPAETIGILVLLYASFRLWRARVMHQRYIGQLDDPNSDTGSDTGDRTND